MIYNIQCLSCAVLSDWSETAVNRREQLLRLHFKKEEVRPEWRGKTKNIGTNLNIFLTSSLLNPCREVQWTKKKNKTKIPEIQINAPPESHALLRLPLHVFITINIECPPSIIPSDKLLFLPYVGTVTDWRRGQSWCLSSNRFQFSYPVVENVRLFLAVSRCQMLLSTFYVSHLRLQLQCRWASCCKSLSVSKIWMCLAFMLY